MPLRKEATDARDSSIQDLLELHPLEKLAQREKLQQDTRQTCWFIAVGTVAAIAAIVILLAPMSN